MTGETLAYTGVTGGVELVECTATDPDDVNLGSGPFSCQMSRVLHVRIEPDNPFEDVAAGKYYYDAVLWAYKHRPQITNGLDETHFGPDATCTRGQIVTFLYRDYAQK